jgi:hypothetical protein
MHDVIGLEIDPSPLSDFRPVVISNFFTKTTDGNKNLHGTSSSLSRDGPIVHEGQRLRFGSIGRE